MPGKDSKAANAMKTGTVLAFTHLLVSSLRLPPVPRLVVTVAGLGVLHELGKQNQSNTVSRAPGLFSSKPIPEPDLHMQVRTAANNVCSGGAGVFDWFFPDGP